MNILVPIQSSSEIEKVVSAGANEVYCGYIPEDWITEYNRADLVEQYGTVPCCLNNRNALKANLVSAGELSKSIEECEKYNIRLYLVLNAKYYPEIAYGYLEKYLELVWKCGVRHLIVSDMGLIHYLNSKFPEFQISVSCLSQATNCSSIRFYTKFSNVERIVLPRHVSVDELVNILRQNADIEFEFFGLSNKCLYDDGFCRGIHDFVPICKDNWDFNFYGKTDPLTLSQAMNLQHKGEDFLRWAKGYDIEGSTEYPWKGVACSLCSLINLYSFPNITLKLAGRGYRIEERVAQISLCKDIYDLAQAGTNLETIQQRVKDFFGLSFFCDGMNCIMRGQDGNSNLYRE